MKFLILLILDLDQINAWMKAETWFTAEEAVQHGFATSVFEYGDVNDMRNTWNVAAYDNAPDWVKSPTPEPKDDEDPVAKAARLQRASNERRLAVLEKIGA